MNESYLIAAIATLLIIILGITGEAIWKWMTRERGPWVVTRVGVGGREFYIMDNFRGADSPLFWSFKVSSSHKHLTKAFADRVAELLLADVAPLSKFIEGGK